MSGKSAMIEIVMPRMGLTMESGTLVKWLKQEGEAVKSGEPLLEIETDKSVVEVEALDDGVLMQILAQPGETLAVGALLGYLAPHKETQHKVAPVQEAVQPTPRIEGKPVQTPIDRPVDVSRAAAKVKASPAARRLAKQWGIALEQIAGSGPGGRVVAWNVAEAHEKSLPIAVASPAQKRVSPIAQRLAAEMGVDINRVQGTGPLGMVTRQDVEKTLRAAFPEKEGALPGGGVLLPPDAILEQPGKVQQRMAERMTHSFTTAPHFYLQAEVDARPLVALRKSLVEVFETRYGVHLTYTDLLLYFCARLLPAHPMLMAQWSEKGLVKFSRVHIGIAVDTERGLFVPVMRDVHQLGLVEISKQRSELTTKARAGKLLPQDYEQGVFTITNLGMLRIDAFQAILNPPQAAILSAGRIRERPMVQDHQVIAGEMVTLTLSADHRVLDGGSAARFLDQLVEWLENPSLSMA
ncbi:MAG: 2-oxo acid dehydrogenase subunit E2 [Chloroflexota bacterium]